MSPHRPQNYSQSYWDGLNPPLRAFKSAKALRMFKQGLESLDTFQALLNLEAQHPHSILPEYLTHLNKVLDLGDKSAHRPPLPNSLQTDKLLVADQTSLKQISLQGDFWDDLYSFWNDRSLPRAQDWECIDANFLQKPIHFSAENKTDTEFPYSLLLPSVTLPSVNKSLVEKIKLQFHFMLQNHSNSLFYQPSLASPSKSTPLPSLQDSSMLDFKESRLPPLPWHFLLDNFRSAHNVGSAFRIADAFGFSSLILHKDTPTPPHKGLARAGRGAETWIPWKQTSTLEEILNFHPSLPWYALEVGPSARNLYHFIPPPSGGILICGSEKSGISKSLLDRCAEVVTIPLCGRKHSLNVSTALAICACHIRQHFTPLK